MFSRCAPLFAFILPALANAGLLHYDLDFETYDSEHSVSGTGFLLADTELDAIIGGQLICDEFVFTWASSDPEALARLDEYYGGDVVHGGLVTGVNELTGETGTFDLMFLLWPPAEGSGFADKLQTHTPEDIWSTIYVSSESRPDGHWMNAPLTTHFTLQMPVSVLYETGGTEVSAPATLPLLMLGLLALAVRRGRQQA